MQRKTLIVITGPTAVGKTAVSLSLARILGTEIISADSRQIFRELKIGTAKPEAEELEAIPHHFIDSHSIGDEIDAARYAREALERIHALFEKHRTLLLCGGSGLYIKAVCEGFDDIPEVERHVRQEIIQKYHERGLAWLQEKMQALDPEYYNRIDQQNPQRLMRALEVKIGTGASMLSYRKQERKDHPFAIVKIGLELPRVELYQRIDARMDKMIAEGLFEEAKELYPYRHHNALQTVGYQEIFGYLEGLYDRDEAVRLLKRNSRRYAKRQLTWFKRDPEITWFHPENSAGIEAHVMNFLRTD